MLVSVVITTKNEEKNIERCLQSIVNQSYKEIEIIVVDNGSTDGTKEIALRYTDKVFDKGPERSAQRNYGMIEKARGEFVMFIDADMALSPDLIKDCVDFIEKDPSPLCLPRAGGNSRLPSVVFDLVEDSRSPSVVSSSSALAQASIHASSHNIAALHISEIVSGNRFWSRVRRFERSFYDGTVIDGARFFRRDLFVKVGGFDETMSGPEDWDIDKKIRQIGTIGLVPARAGRAVIYHNEAEFDLKKYLNKKSYYTRSFAVYIAKWGKDDPDIKRQFGLYYRYFGVFLENGKWKKLATHPILAFGMYFLKGLVGIVYIMNKK